MSRSRAMRSAFSVIFREPVIYLSELVWRLAFTAAAALVVFYALLAYLDSLPVSNLDLFGLAGVVPGTAGLALKHIFRGSGPTLVRAVLAAIVGCAFLWWFASSMGRATTVAALFRVPRPAFRRFATLNGVRMLFAAMTALAYIGVVLLAMNRAQRAGGGHDPETFYLFFVPLALIVGLLWSTIDWYLSLAPFASSEREGLLAQLRAAADVSRAQSSQFFWVQVATGIPGFLLKLAALFFFIFVLSLALETPAIIGWMIIVLYATAYAAVSTFLHLLRVAAYARIMDYDRAQRMPQALAAVV